jgi:cytochrome c biogenesis protein CcmG/thiol:disulfide interchange protein DsbE
LTRINAGQAPAGTVSQVSAPTVGEPRSGSEGAEGEPPRRGAFAWPLLIFVALAVLLGIGLTLDPREIPSPLIDRAVSQFRLIAVQGRTLGLSSEDLRGEVSVVNVFASWCTACRDEHPLWMEIARDRTFPVHGLNYKDQPGDASRWLDQLGDPYTRTGADIDGRAGIDWGVYGVPETFVVDKHGVIRHKIIGAITREKVGKELIPLVRRLQAE